MKYILAFLFLAAFSSAKEFPAPPLEWPGYTLCFHDEFDGPQLDTNRWIAEYFPGRFKSPSPAIHAMRGGCLVLITDGSQNTSSIQTYNTWNFHKTYERPEGEVPTVDRFTRLYGYFETRSRISSNAHHSAFWALEAKMRGDEVDIHELESYRYGAMHLWDKATGKNSKWDAPGFHFRAMNELSSSNERSREFHLYGMEVYANGLRLYHDRKLLADRKVDWHARGEVPLGFFLGLYGQAKIPSEHEIDYFRAWEKKPAPRIEAEDLYFDSNSFIMEESPSCSGNLRIRNLGQGKECVARFHFNESSGKFRIRLSGMESRKGEGEIALRAEGREIARWVLEANAVAAAEFVTKPWNLSKGDAIELTMKSGSETGVPMDFLAFEEVK